MVIFISILSHDRDWHFNALIIRKNALNKKKKLPKNVLQFIYNSLNGIKK